MSVAHTTDWEKMDSLAWPLMQVIALLVQVIFLTSIYLNLLLLYRARKLGEHLNYGVGLLYAILLLCCAVHLGLSLTQPTLDQATRFSGFKLFGVGSALLGLMLTFYSNSAKKKLLAS